MTTIERRLEALETLATGTEPMVFIVRAVAPGPDREMDTADVHGIKLRRNNNESEEDFIERAKAIGLASIEPPSTGAIVVLTTAERPSRWTCT